MHHILDFDKKLKLVKKLNFLIAPILKLVQLFFKAIKFTMTLIFL